MSRTPSYDMLVGACAAHDLDSGGTEEELKRRLGDHLVARLFAADKKKKRQTSTSTSPSNKRPATAWHAFLQTEKERVKECGFRGRVDILKECARRWKLFKRVNTPEAPLMLTTTSEAGSSSSSSLDSSVYDDLVETLKELPEPEVNAGLASLGFPVEEDDPVGNAMTLARAMMA